MLGSEAFGTAAVTDEPMHSLLGLSVYVVSCLALLAFARWLQPATAAGPAAAPQPRSTPGS